MQVNIVCPSDVACGGLMCKQLEFLCEASGKTWILNFLNDFHRSIHSCTNM